MHDSSSEREETLVQAGGNQTLTVQGHHIDHGLFYRTTPHLRSTFLFSLQLSHDDLNHRMLLGMQADGVSVLDQLSSMCLPGTTDTVSADGEYAACLPWVARLGQARPAHHLGLISAPRQQPV